MFRTRFLSVRYLLCNFKSEPINQPCLLKTHRFSFTIEDVVAFDDGTVLFVSSALLSRSLHQKDFTRTTFRKQDGSLFLSFKRKRSSRLVKLLRAKIIYVSVLYLNVPRVISLRGWKVCLIKDDPFPLNRLQFHRIEFRVTYL